jgi:hypothetical protein
LQELDATRRREHERCALLATQSSLIEDQLRAANEELEVA